MNCSECQAWLQLQWDGAKPIETAAVIRHLADCIDCRGWQKAIQRLQRGLKLFPRPAAPPHLAGRIVAQALNLRRERRRLLRRRFAFAALAAGIMLAILAGWFRLRFQDEVAQRLAPPSAAQPPEGTVPASPRDTVEEAGSAVVSLSLQARDRTVEQTRWFWEAALPPVKLENLDLPQPLQPPADSLKEASKGVSDGLQPVADHARRAFDLFLREVPPVSPAGRTNF
jgi:hypothetical protein